MHTIRLKIHDNVYKNFIWLLSKFSRDEIEIINESETYLQVQAALQEELNEMNEGKASYHTIDELEARLDERIKKHEINL